MELTEVWVPEITSDEIEADGLLLDDKYNNMLYRYIEDRVLCKLYYLKSKDIFVLLNPTGQLSVISSQYQIDNLRNTYFKEESNHTGDTFAEVDNGEHYTPFQPDVNVSDPESVIKYGQLLHAEEYYSIYYVEQLDTFVYINMYKGKPKSFCYSFESLTDRKKYNIPYQDERKQETLF